MRLFARAFLCMCLPVNLLRHRAAQSAFAMALDIARWDTVSGWRDHFLMMALGDLCFVYEEIVTDIIRVIAEATQAPTKCPIADGTYRGGNAPARISPLRHFPSLPYGRYRVYTLYLFPKPLKGPKVRGCMRIIADVVTQNE
ncbi:uncharacterized protein LOC117652833 [Thrips palmi]|uniref:Uncharacterized protein LOC117652833 n=1 Tax=Thrips palmi TaxID=161013 RepID=A0A6P9A8M8_THRPL|nr:uncharacterized protein LOC117652833 [Thrips palmi]